MDLATYGYAFAAALHTALAIALLHDRPFRQSPMARSFIAAVGSTAAWGWCALASRFAAAPLAALAASGFDLLRYAFWFACVLRLLHPTVGGSSRGTPLLARVGGALVVAELVLSLWRIVGAPGSEALGRLTFAVALSLPVFGLLLVEQLYRNLAEDSRWSSKPLCLALALLFAFDIYFFSHAALFSRFDADAVNVRGAIHSVCVPLLFLAAKRQSGRGTNLRLSRAAVFHTATLLLVGGYLLFISAVGYYVRRFGGDWGSALQLALLFVAAVALLAVLLSGTMRAKLRVFVGKNFFTYRYDYRAEWLRFTANLSAAAAPQEVGIAVVRGLADMVESRAGALWFKAPNETLFTQTAHWNMPRSSEREDGANSPLTQFLERTGWIVDIDECQAAPRSYEGLVLPGWLLELPSRWLLVPLLVADDLIGFVVLAHARTSVQVNWEVRDLLKTASRQAAGFLAQMHATEALLETRKFDAFNRMSAFVVHDLKNIVAQLSLMLKNAKRLHANPEFQQDMLATVENSLDKMRQMMLQLREGQAPASGVSGVDLAPIAQRLAKVAAERGRALELRSVESVFTRGSAERIERVLGHMVQNAMDATTPNERVWLEIARASGQAKVVVGDAGHGMSQEFVQTRLFKPFNTTKHGGMGIGAYESSQYLKELGGSIAVESEVGQGTIVTILLPLLETRTRSDLELSETR